MNCMRYQWQTRLLKRVAKERTAEKEAGETKKKEREEGEDEEVDVDDQKLVPSTGCGNLRFVGDAISLCESRSINQEEENH